jgi:uncharacterized protein with GYD domain
LEGATSCFATFGRADIVAFVNVEDFKGLTNFAFEASKVEGVTATETLPEAEVA